MLSEIQIKKARKQLYENYDAGLPKTFSALGDPCRLYIFQLLLLQHEVCVTDVAKVCKKTVPAASQQLKILEQSGLLIRQRRGQMVCYKLKRDSPTVKQLIQFIYSLHLIIKSNKINK
ncbi:MAG: winged helix-turn-helix transcriptional regulator [Candidatus Nealsonbacteria bacterium]|nr:winged helix-turn-helix transcriptional regulator [Candidatus Nealsonbacteria bacterium]